MGSVNWLNSAILIYRPDFRSTEIYRITADLKIKTDIIASMATSLTGRAVILLIMYVEIFKTGDIVFIGDVKTCFSISESFLAHASCKLT